MKGKKNASTGHLDIDTTLLEELFPSNDSFTLHSFSDDDLAAIGSLLSYAPAVGAMVTFFCSQSERNLCISIRFGQRKRSLQLNGDDVDSTFIRQLANGFQRIYLASLTDGGPAEAVTKAEKRAKGKD